MGAQYPHLLLRIRSAVVSDKVGSYFPPFPGLFSEDVKKVPKFTWEPWLRETTSTYLGAVDTSNPSCYLCNMLGELKHSSKEVGCQSSTLSSAGENLNLKNTVFFPRGVSYILGYMALLVGKPPSFLLEQCYAAEKSAVSRKMLEKSLINCFNFLFQCMFSDLSSGGVFL